MSAARLDRYHALALQVACDGVHPDADVDTARARMRASIQRIDRAITGAQRWIGSELRLVVLPEYFLTGFPWGESVPEWTAKAALDIEGPEYASLAQVAASHQVYLAGNAYERDPHFPGLYFQCSFVLDPAGVRILGYRRLISLFAPTPHDVWDAYLDVYGLEGVFPVADTPLGRLAAIASEEILYPEIARCHAIRGAEVFLHSTSEITALTATPKQVARRARALENQAFVVSANNAALTGSDIPDDSCNGCSEIIDYLGNPLIRASGGDSMVANASLDLAGLRAHRGRPGMGNLLARQALDLYAASFAQADIRRPNGLLHGGKVKVPDRSYFLQQQADAIERLHGRKLIG